MNLIVWDLKKKEQIGMSDLFLSEMEVDDNEIIKNLFCFGDNFKKLLVRSDDKKGIKVIELSDFTVLSEVICDHIIS